MFSIIAEDLEPPFFFTHTHEDTISQKVEQCQTKILWFVCLFVFALSTGWCSMWQPWHLSNLFDKKTLATSPPPSRQPYPSVFLSHRELFTALCALFAAHSHRSSNTRASWFLGQDHAWLQPSGRHPSLCQAVSCSGAVLSPTHSFSVSLEKSSGLVAVCPVVCAKWFLQWEIFAQEFLCWK